jgi:hypothetical protein
MYLIDNMRYNKLNYEQMYHLMQDRKIKKLKCSRCTSLNSPSPRYQRYLNTSYTRAPTCARTRLNAQRPRYQRYLNTPCRPAKAPPSTFGLPAKAPPSTFGRPAKAGVAVLRTGVEMLRTGSRSTRTHLIDSYMQSTRVELYQYICADCKSLDEDMRFIPFIRKV